jgi:hypothetical protein
MSLGSAAQPMRLLADGVGQALDEYRHGPLYVSQKLIRAAIKEVKKTGMCPMHQFFQVCRGKTNTPCTFPAAGALIMEEMLATLGAQVLTRHDQPLSRSRCSLLKEWSTY